MSSSNLRRRSPEHNDPPTQNPYGFQRTVTDATHSLSEQLQGLEGEKISLMKRLNMVLAELEKATHEKSDVALKLREQERHAEELRQKLNEVSSLKTVVNKNLQNDLNYEKGMNNNLRDELNHFEQEKDSLLLRLKDEEQIGAEIAHETNEVNHNLVRKVDDLQRLEQEHDLNSRRLRELNDQLEILRGQEINTRQQKVHLEEQLADLAQQRNDLSHRIGDLTQKYDGYVHRMGVERNDLTHKNRVVVREQVAKLLMQILEENIRLKRKNAFQEIFSTSKFHHLMQSRLQKYGKILIRYYDDRQRRLLRIWYRNAFNCVYESRKRTHIIDTNVSEARRRKFFYMWRSNYLNRRNKFGGKMEGTKILSRVIAGMQERHLRRYICKWRDAVQLRLAQQAFIGLNSHRTQKSKMQRAFVIWLGYTRKQALLDKYDKLSDIVTTTWFKQRVFLALKHACAVQRTDTSMAKFTAWKNWCDTAREQKYFAKKRQMVARQQGLRTGRLLKQCYDAIRYFNVQTKFENTRSELERKIPEKESLEYRRECLINNAAARTKIHAVRQFYLRHCDVQYRALMIWKDAVVHYKHTMKRLKMQMMHWHSRGLSGAFMQWKEFADKAVHAKLMEITREQLNENQNLLNDMHAKKVVVANQHARAQKHRTGKLDHILNMLDRRDLKRCFYKWIEGAVKINNLDTALDKLQKIETKGRKRMALFKFRAQAKAITREAFTDKRAKAMQMMRGEASLKDCWRGWVHHLQQTQLARRFIKRALNGQARNARSDYFFKWKSLMAQEVHATFDMNIQELNMRQVNHQAKISDTKAAIQDEKNTKQHLLYQMKSLSRKIMTNFIERSLNMQLARGFYTWRDEVKDFNQKRRTIRKYLLFMQKSQLQVAFRSWARTTVESQEIDLQERLAGQEAFRKQVVAEGKEAMEAYEQEEAEMEENLKVTIANRDAMQFKFKNAFETHSRRARDNVYVEKKRNIFTCWRDFVQREKYAVNIIGAIARRTLRVEVFQRIARRARENHLDERAEKIIIRFRNMFLLSLLRKGMSRWRENTFKLTVRTLEVTKMNYANTLSANANHLDQIHNKKVMRAQMVMDRNKTRKVNTAFKEMTKIMKALRVQQDVLRQNIAFNKEKRALQKWFQRVKVTQYLRKRDEQVIDSYRKMMLKRIWQGWLAIASEEQRKMKLMTRCVKRMQFLDRAAAFQHWAHYTISARERDAESKDHSSKSIQSILEGLLKRRMALALHQLKLRAFKKDYKWDFLRRVTSHCADYRIRHFFAKWKQFCKLEEIAHTVNTEGDVVLARNEAMRQAKAMRDYLINSGYSPEEIEQYLNAKAGEQKNNMQKGIISLFFANSEFQIMPKAFNQWKAWVARRKFIRQRALFVVNMMKHPCARLFYRWKYEHADAMARLKALSKNQLIDKIIADENLIGATEARLVRMDDAIDHLAMQRETLLGHYMRGQKLAVALFRNNYLKTMMRAFLRWKRANQEFETRELMEQLDRTNQMISELGCHVGRLGDINRNLLGENEELRQTALDGIEIAKVVQELTKERESLSQDLVDRAGTIKRLIEDNNNLSVRLGMLQREAQELDTLNRQAVFVDPPQRDTF